MKPQTLLVPVDFSDVTAGVVAYAGMLAQQFGSRVILLHIAEPDPDFIGYEAGPAVAQTNALRELRTEHRQLDALKQELLGRGIETVALQVQGSVSDRILQEARTQQAGMIILGSHGHGAIYNLLLGSMPSAILKDAPCPVLVIPAQTVSEPTAS